MSCTKYKRPSRRAATYHTESEQEQEYEYEAEYDTPVIEAEYHAPYEHEGCSQCEAALLESIEEEAWQYPELLPALNDTWFHQPDVDPFAIYRHFHPFYSYNYTPYEKQFTLIARPGKPLLRDVQVGDILLLRNNLSNRTSQSIITDNRLRMHDELGNGSIRKPGAYIQVFGNAWGNGNNTGFIRIQNKQQRTPDDVIVIRKASNYQAAHESEAQTTDYMEAIKDYKLKLVKYGKSGSGYMYTGDRSINYQPLFTANKLSDFDARTALHFLETEGGIDSINTYDNQIITWGFGFAGKPGNLTIALHLFLQANEQARNDFKACGITLDSEKKTALTITTDEHTYTGDAALKFWKLSKPHLNALIQFTQDYAKDAFNAQWQTFKRIHQSVFSAFNDPQYLANITNEQERNKARAAVLHAHHHYPGFNPPATFRNATSLEEVLSIYVDQSSKYGSVQGHANNWRRNLNTVFSEAAPNSGEAVPSTPSGTLTSSVGRGAQNKPADVQLVQALLNSAGIDIAVTGQLQDTEGDPTILAIYHYQSIRHLPACDGRIDPNGGTFKALLSEAK